MNFDRRKFLESTALAAVAAALPASADSLPLETVLIDTRQVTGALPHIWEECVGSDRAAITLRESWRRDLDRGRLEAGIKRVRFHGIFNDELGVYAPTILNRNKVETPNFQNVDQVYDGLLAHGVSPFVELSFMPKKLASADRKFGFYGGNISPPASNEAWAEFVKSFVIHLVDRYGLATVKTWPLEVWNEANLPFFWTGTQQQYFDLYKATSIAIKSIDAGLQVGGPSTSKTEWISELADFCADNNAPIDFFSTHVYAGDAQEKMFGKTDRYPQADVIPEAMRRARAKIDATRFRNTPLWLSEWSSDSPAMIAHVVAGCLASCQAMSHWVLSGTYEELGVAEHIITEGTSSYSLLYAGGIAKPSFNTYKLLHSLGNERLAATGPVLATQQANRSVSALIWNLADVPQLSGIPDSTSIRSVKGETKRYQVEFAGARSGQRVKVSFVDQERGSPIPAWRAMGSPQYIKPAQIAELTKRANIAPPVVMKLNAARQLTVDLPPEGVALIELV